MERFTTHDGLELAYLDVGRRDEVILLHGFAANHEIQWVAPGVVDALREEGHRVIALDMRGHGESDKPHDPASYSELAMVRDVQALFEHLGLSSVPVVGYSMGAHVTARLAPVDARVSRVVLGGVGAHMASASAPDGRSAIADALDAADPASIDNPIAKQFRTFADSTGSDRVALAALMRAPRDQERDYSAISVPTLVLTGEKDTLAGDPGELAKLIPGATFKVVRSDHLRAVFDPAFSRAIVDFVEA